MKSIVYVSLLMLLSCAQTSLVGDRRLSPHDIPSFLADLRQKPRAEFYEKINDEGKFPNTELSIFIITIFITLKRKAWDQRSMMQE